MVSHPYGTPEYNSLQLIAPSPGVGPGIGGSVLKAPIGTALPVGTEQVLNAAFTDLGYVDENGIRDREERRNTDVFAWGGGLIGNLQQSYARTLTVRFMQFLNPNVLEVAFGQANVTVTPPTTYSGTEIAAALNANLLDDLSWVFQGFYQSALVAKVIPIARVVSVAEVDFTHRQFTSVEATMKCFPDTNNNHEYLYVNDGVLSTGGFS
jgi:hypothetical protein